MSVVTDKKLQPPRRPFGRERGAGMEEFTFPCVPLDQSNAKKLPFASQPPWLTAVHEHDHVHRRSFSAAEPQATFCRDHRHHGSVTGGGHHYHHHGSARHAAVEEEDKMDMLWEDFNEELARAAAAPPCPLTRGSPWATTKEPWFDYDDGETTRKRAVVRRRRMGLLMMLRLLKKLFLAHKSGATASRKAPPI